MPGPQAARWLLVLVWMTGAATAAAQSANDGFNVGAGAEVRAIAVQPDGKLLVGGSFTQFGGQTRQRLARVNYNGTVDSSFNISVNGPVNAIAVDANGRIVIGGEFTQVAGQPRPFLAWINPDGSLGGPVTAPNNVVHTIISRGSNRFAVGGDFTQVGTSTERRFLAGYRIVTVGSLDDLLEDPLFRPSGINGPVLALARQPNGRILLGGNFTQVAGQTRTRLARLIPTADGTPELDAGFAATANGVVRALTVQPDGDVVIGGDFSQLNGQNRAHVGRVRHDGVIDAGFNPGANQPVRALAVQEDGRVLLAGEFTNVGGQTRNRIARLQRSGALDTGFSPSIGNNVLALAVLFDGKLVLGGTFTSVAGQTRNRIARLYPDGRLDQNLQLSSNASTIRAVAVQPDGRIVVGGSFDTIAGQTRRGIARLHPDGSLDSSFNTGNDAYDVHAIAIRPDGRIVVGGVGIVARLNANGTRDNQFPAATVAGTVHALVALDDGGVIIGGPFTLVNAAQRSGMARLTNFGQVTSYNPNPELGTVFTLALQPDGKLLVGGSFQRIAGNGCHGHARLTATGAFDAILNTQIAPDVRAITLQPDGRILVGGGFATSGGSTPDKLMRLEPNGTRDFQFFQGGTIRFASDPTGQFGSVRALAVQADGRILIGGQFDRVSGQTRRNLARLNPNGSLDTSFNADVTPVGTGEVLSLAGQRDGKWLVAGTFSEVGGAGRLHLARVRSDTTGSERMLVTDGELRWLREGSAPEAALPPRLTLSLDGQSFAAPGTMQRIDGGWGLPGFAAPDAAYWLRISAPTHDGGSSSTGWLESTRGFGPLILTPLPDPIFSNRFQ